MKSEEQEILPFLDSDIQTFHFHILFFQNGQPK